VEDKNLEIVDWGEEDDQLIQNIKSPTPVYFKGKTYYLLPESVTRRTLGADSEYEFVVYN